MHGAGVGTGGIHFRTLRIITSVIPIVDPLPGIAQNIEQSKAVRAFLRNQVGPVAAIVLIPGDLVEFCVASFLTPTSSRIFPLCLGGKTPTRPAAIIPRLVPSDNYHGHLAFGIDWFCCRA